MAGAKPKKKPKIAGDLAYRKYANKSVLEGRTIIPKQKWLQIHGYGEKRLLDQKLKEK